MQQSGDSVDSPRPALLIFFDPKTQTVNVVNDPDQVGSADFARGLLKMADDHMAAMQGMQRVAALQQKEAAAKQRLQEEMQVQKLMKGPLRVH